MRKIILLISGLLTVSGISAQITLTSETNVPRVGDVFRYHVMEVENLNVTHGGENQEWDMSEVEEGIISEIKYISVAESTEPFSTSNLVGFSEQNGITSERYHTASSSGFVLNKLIVPFFLTQSFTEAQPILKFPLTYNQEYNNERFAGTILNESMGQDFEIEGTVNIKADGYGKLKLPFGTIDNVLRVTAAYTVEVIGFPVIETDSAYMWYSANTRNVIAIYTVIYVDKGMGMEKAGAMLQYLSQEDIVDDIITSRMNTTSDKSFTVYPNPTQGILNIEGTNEIPNVKIYNVNGALLRQEKSSVIDISDHENGLYIMEIAGKKYKIVKQ